MASPQEPDDEPVGGDLPDKVSAEDALWRSIVDNYGDRPELDEPAVETPPSPRDLTPSGPGPVEESQRPEPPDPEDHFVPPEPPPLPTPPPARLLAWLGLFGVPAFVLVALVAKLDLPAWTGLLLMLWFVGGFVFLVVSMGPDPGRDHDDGARL